ncbi:hypothetical protein [Streptomyces albogriseolus]|uniref:hypothetical protein n=1 Tax=Streptomyces albogriseolus TaxID=1887 RepID=UPI003F4E1B70
MLRRLGAVERFLDAVRGDEKQHLASFATIRPVADRGPWIAWFLCGALIISVALRIRKGAQSIDGVVKGVPCAPCAPERTGLRRGPVPRAVSTSPTRSPEGGDADAQPAADHVAFGMPTEDDGSRDDPLLSDRSWAVSGYRPDADAITAAPPRGSRTSSRSVCARSSTVPRKTSSAGGPAQVDWARRTPGVSVGNVVVGTFRAVAAGVQDGVAHGPPALRPVQPTGDHPKQEVPLAGEKEDV